MRSMMEHLHQHKAPSINTTVNYNNCTLFNEENLEMYPGPESYLHLLHILPRPGTHDARAAAAACPSCPVDHSCFIMQT